MRKDDINEFRCKTCGGNLEVEDPTLGIVKCVNCSNRARLDGDLTKLMQLKQTFRPQQILVNMTDKQVEKISDNRKKQNVVLAIKAIIAILALLIAGVFITVITYVYKGVFELGNLELGLVIAVGIGVPAFMSVFSKVYNYKNVSIGGYVLVLLLFITITIGILYYAITNYFVEILN